MWAVFTFLWWHPEVLSWKDLLAFVHNVGALALLTRGAAALDELSHGVGLCRLLLARPRFRVRWESVDSDSNPADGLSGPFAADPLSREQGWRPVEVREPNFRFGDVACLTALDRS